MQSKGEKLDCVNYCISDHGHIILVEEKTDSSEISFGEHWNLDGLIMVPEWNQNTMQTDLGNITSVY